MTKKKLKVAYVIGNGLSREGFDLKKLDKCITAGCNSIYKDFQPNYLIAIDRWMDDSPCFAIERLLCKKVTKKNPRKWTYVTRKMVDALWWMAVDDEPVIAEIALNRGFCHNSGMYASLLLSQVQRYDVVYMIGFDFFRNVLDEDGKQQPNDVYGGTYESHSGMIKVWNHMFNGAPTSRIVDDKVIIENAIDTKFVRVGPMADADRDFYATELDNLEYIENFADMPICKA